MEIISDLFGKRYDLSPSINDIKKTLRSDSKKGIAIDLKSLMKQEGVEKKRKTLLRWLDAVISERITIYQDLENMSQNGYDVGEVTSAIQKEVRRGKEFLACWWARELLMSPSYRGVDYCWRRVRVISAEDIGNIDILQEVENLFIGAKNIGFMSEDGIENLMKAVFIEAKCPRKTRFFDDLSGYFGNMHDGKIKQDEWMEEFKGKADQDDFMVELEEKILSGDWYRAAWFAQQAITCGKVKVSNTCLNKILEMSEKCDDRHRRVVKTLLDQSDCFSNQEKGAGSCDSIRCILMAVFALAKNISGGAMDTVDIPNYKTEDILSEFNLFKEKKPFIPDYARDGHTRSGKMLGRGDRYWYSTSRRINNQVNIIPIEIEHKMLRLLQLADGVSLTDQEFEEYSKTL